jgi:hypothetical protein
VGEAEWLGEGEGLSGVAEAESEVVGERCAVVEGIEALGVPEGDPHAEAEGEGVRVRLPVARAEADTDGVDEPDGEAVCEGDAEDWTVGSTRGVRLGVCDSVALPQGKDERVPEPVSGAKALGEREGEGVTENDAEPVLEGVPVGGWEAKADAETLLAEDAAAVVEPVGEGTALPPVAEVVLVVVGESKALPPVAEAVRVAVGEVEPVMEAEPDA